MDGESTDETKVSLQCPHPSLGLGGPCPTPDSFIGECTQHRFRNKTKGWTLSLCQGQGAGQRVSALHAHLQELSLSPLSTERLGASVFQPRHPLRPFSLTTEVPATAQLPSQPSHPSPGHSCTHKSGAECEALKDREEDAGFEPGQSLGNAGIEGK